MLGSWKWNVGLGTFSFFITLAFALIHNTWFTALVRSCWAFVLGFLLAYLLRWILAQGKATSQEIVESETPSSMQVALEGTEDEFQLLQYNHPQADQVTQAVRQWSKEEA